MKLTKLRQKAIARLLNPSPEVSRMVYKAPTGDETENLTSIIAGGREWKYNPKKGTFSWLWMDGDNKIDLIVRIDERNRRLAFKAGGYSKEGGVRYPFDVEAQSLKDLRDYIGRNFKIEILPRGVNISDRIQKRFANMLGHQL